MKKNVTKKINRANQPATLVQLEGLFVKYGDELEVRIRKNVIEDVRKITEDVIDDLALSIGAQFHAIDLRFDRVEDRLDIIDTRLDVIEVRLDVIEEKVDNVEFQLLGIDSRIIGINNRMDDFAENFVRKDKLANAR